MRRIPTSVHLIVGLREKDSITTTVSWGVLPDQYKPDLVEDNQHIKPDGTHLNKLLADKAISYLQKQKQLAPENLSSCTTPRVRHTRHTRSKNSGATSTKGSLMVDGMCSAKTVFANQKKLGVIPANAKLPARDPYLKAWKDVPAEEQKLFARFMEVYAGVPRIHRL